MTNIAKPLNLKANKVSMNNSYTVASNSVSLNIFNNNYETIDYNVNLTDTVEEHIKNHGDINNDGSITIKDRTLLEKYMNSGPVSIANDVNGDGIVNRLDIKSLENYLVNGAQLYTCFNLEQNSLSYKDTYSDGTATAEFQVFTSEPDPAIAINYWSDILNTEDFVYPKDDKTGLSLGAWPKNYQDYPVQLNNMKVYNDYYIWPATPENGVYNSVYNHNGIDILTTFGTPIYSPVDGNIVYSEWGHTPNKGSDETAYSVTIAPDNIISFNGTEIDEIFLTHMSGIRYRCGEGDKTIHVKKGELLGFSGTAASSADVPGFASHVHISYYNSSDYDSTGLYTNEIEQFYNISNQDKINVGK